MCVWGVKCYPGIFVCVLSGGVGDIICDGRSRMPPFLCGCCQALSQHLLNQVRSATKKGLKPGKVDCVMLKVANVASGPLASSRDEDWATPVW